MPPPYEVTEANLSAAAQAIRWLITAPFDQPSAWTRFGFTHQRAGDVVDHLAGERHVGAVGRVRIPDAAELERPRLRVGDDELARVGEPAPAGEELVLADPVLPAPWKLSSSGAGPGEPLGDVQQVGPPASERVTVPPVEASEHGRLGGGCGGSRDGQ